MIAGDYYSDPLSGVLYAVGIILLIIFVINNHNNS